MSRLVWGDPDKRFYETGVDRGVFYPLDGVGVPWNGLIAVSEAPSGGDVLQGYFDGEKYRQQRARESFSATLRAYTYPREFESYDGVVSPGHTNQRRKMFNLSYRTTIASDASAGTHHLIHLVYNAVVSPAPRNFTTINSAVSAITFDWKLETVPEILSTGEVSAHIIVNTAMAYPWAVHSLESILYGDASMTSRFPSMTEVINLFENASIVRITDHGDGTWTAEGPEDAVYMLDSTTFAIDWPSAVYIDESTYRVSSL